MSVPHTDQVLDEYGRGVPGAEIYVTDTITIRNADLTIDGTAPLAQPVIADEFGFYTYWANDGIYREDIYYGGKLRYKGLAYLGVPPELKGDPGGNILAVNTFVGASALTIPIGTKLVMVSGTNTDGDSGAGRIFAYSASVNAAYVAAHPNNAFIDQAGLGRGFREVNPKQAITPETFGAYGDGADDSAALQAACDALTAIGGGCIAFDGRKTYTVNATFSLSNLSHFTIRGNGATIKAKNGMTVGSNTQLFKLTGCTDFRIEGLIFDGNRANRTPAETGSHLVHLTNCQRFTIVDSQANNATTDGWRFESGNVADASTFCRDFTLINCRADNAYRNGCGVIDGLDFLLIGGSYTNTTGTAPQAGVDVESNGTSVDPGNRSGRFVGVRFEGNAGYGLQISASDSPEAMQVDACYFANNTLGGVSVGCRVVFNGGLFENFSATSIGINVTSNPGDAAVCMGTEFRNFGSSTSCVTASSDGAKLIGCRFYNIATCTLSGATVVVSGCTVDTASGIPFNILSGALSVVVSDNRIVGATGRAIFCPVDNAKITNNHCKDVASVSGAYIQAEGAHTVITGNTCEASTAQATTIGLRASQNATAVAFNTCINLHTTDPYFFSGTETSTSAFVGFNSGGTANNTKKIRYGLAAISQATYAAATGGTTVDTQARASLVQLAADFADLKAKIRAVGVMEA